MLQDLSQKFSQKLKKIARRGIIREEHITESLKDIKKLLLEADVNYRVVNSFLRQVKDQAIGKEVAAGLTASQTFIDILYRQLKIILGDKGVPLLFKDNSLNKILLFGLQGSGKTTCAGKLAFELKKKNHKPLLVPLDMFRAAAIKQLQILAQQAGADFYPSEPNISALENANNALTYAQEIGADYIIFDSQGRSQIDKELMQELEQLNKLLVPPEKLLVLDAMTGQEALNIAREFDQKLDLSGFILSKADSDARGGAILSLSSVSGKPIKYLGNGEKIEDLKQFDPNQLARTILNMGDSLALIEQLKKTAQQTEHSRVLENIRKNQFTLIDFEQQLTSINKMGFKSLAQNMAAMPGLSGKRNIDQEETEKSTKRMLVIIKSMTLLEKINPKIVNGSRKLRIAKGSGTSVPEVNNLLKKFKQIKDLSQKIGKVKNKHQMLDKLKAAPWN